MSKQLLQRDLAHLWHPCSQMKDYEMFEPLIVQRAQGSYLELSNGKKIIDAISSWWCKSLGHGEPRLQKALINQLQQFEHVILANTTNETIVRLSEKLAGLTASLNKVLYASDGSSAVEMALKISLHTRYIAGDNQRNRLMSLSNSYHGETALALSVSDVGLYRRPYEAVLLPTLILSNIPYVHDTADILWSDCSEVWPIIENQLELHRETLSAIIIEPIVQAAAGMLIYSQDFLKRLRSWTKKYGIHLIADEIMTGLGRTGLPLACQHAGIEPDILCLGKSLTSGFLPLSAVMTSQTIYDLFYDDYETGKAFLHSHTHSGNALAAAVALAYLSILETDPIYQRVQKLQIILKTLMQEIAEVTGKLKNVRSIGAVVAADLSTDSPQQRLGYAVYRRAVELGALLRPLGNTIYWVPPLNVEEETLLELKKITQRAILEIVN